MKLYETNGLCWWSSCDGADCGAFARTSRQCNVHTLSEISVDGTGR